MAFDLSMVDSLHGMASWKIFSPKFAVSSTDTEPTITPIKGDITADRKTSSSPSLSVPVALDRAGYGRSFEDALSSDSELSDSPDELNTQSHPFAPTLLSPAEEDDLTYQRDLKTLKILVACAKAALLTDSFTAQVETAAELSLCMSDMEKIYPGFALGGGVDLEDDIFRQDEDLSSDTEGFGAEDDLSSLEEDISSGTEEFRTEDDPFSLDEADSSGTIEGCPCPYASTYRCTENFDTERAAIIHSTEHTVSSGKYLCPYAGEYDCTKTLASLAGARRHGDAVHLTSKPFPCPHAEEYHCRMFFSQQSHAIRHGQIHTREEQDSEDDEYEQTNFADKENSRSRSGGKGTRQGVVKGHSRIHTRKVEEQDSDDDEYQGKNTAADEEFRLRWSERRGTNPTVRYYCSESEVDSNEEG